MPRRTVSVTDLNGIVAGSIEIELASSGGHDFGIVRHARRTSANAQKGAYALAYHSARRHLQLVALQSDMERSQQAERLWSGLRADHDADGVLKYRAHVNMHADDPNSDVREDGEDVYGNPVRIRPRASFWTIAESPTVAQALTPGEFELWAFLQLGPLGASPVGEEDAAVFHHCVEQGLEALSGAGYAVVPSGSPAGSLVVRLHPETLHRLLVAYQQHTGTARFADFVEAVAVAGGW